MPRKTVVSNQKSLHPTVFISYSWDSDEHKCNVVDLADRLRSHGIDCNLDQDETSPVKGWQNWIRNQIEQSDYVLIVCTEIYQRRYEGREQPDIGHGVAWEGAIISQLVYDQLYDQQRNAKFIPIVFEQRDINYIPLDIKKYTRYLLNPSNFELQESGYEDLYRHLTNKSRKDPTIPLPPLEPRKKHRFKPPNIDNEIQQQKLTRIYRDAQNYYQKEYWEQVISIFQHMQDAALPYYDPDGIYRSARRKLIEEEQELRRLDNIYTQGKKYYQKQNWFDAQRKFDKVLQSQPRDRDLRERTEIRLAQTKENLDKEKLIATTLIITSWIISSFFAWQNPPAMGFLLGGIASGITIWWISDSRKKLEASQQTQKILMFFVVGLAAELIIRQIFRSFPSASSISWIIEFLAGVSGIAISMRVMSWLINRRLQGK